MSIPLSILQTSYLAGVYSIRIFEVLVTLATLYHVVYKCFFQRGDEQAFARSKAISVGFMHMSWILLWEHHRKPYGNAHGLIKHHCASSDSRFSLFVDVEVSMIGERGVPNRLRAVCMRRI